MDPEASTSRDPGSHHLEWILRFQLLLVLPMAGIWLLRSPRASLAFLAGAAASLLFWVSHRWIVACMLTPSLRRRWFFGVLGMAKLTLLALYLRAMMGCFPTEVLPLTTGILLFVAAILLEAGRLMVAPDPRDQDGQDKQG